MGGRKTKTLNFGVAGTYDFMVSISQSDKEALGDVYLVHQESKSIVAKGNSEQDLRESFKNYLKKERIKSSNYVSKLESLESILGDSDLRTVNEFYQTLRNNHQTLRNKMEGGN